MNTYFMFDSKAAAHNGTGWQCLGLFFSDGLPNPPILTCRRLSVFQVFAVSDLRHTTNFVSLLSLQQKVALAQVLGSHVNDASGLGYRTPKEFAEMPRSSLLH